MVTKVEVKGINLIGVVVSRWVDWEAPGYKFSDEVNIELPMDLSFSVGVGVIEGKKAEVVRGQWSIRFDVLDDKGHTEQDCLDAFYAVGASFESVVKGMVDSISDYVEFDKEVLALSDVMCAELKKVGVTWHNGYFSK